MSAEEFKSSLAEKEPPAVMPAPLAALWWDAKGDWSQAHDLVDELETPVGMAVHAYLHRKEGSASNADYWYHRAGHNFRRPTLEAEWTRWSRRCSPLRNVKLGADFVAATFR
jgi:hypothetical protein